MIPRHTQFDAAISRATEDILKEFSQTQRVNFALKIMLDTTSPDALAALNWAAVRVAEHGNILLREAFEQECG